MNPPTVLAAAIALMPVSGASLPPISACRPWSPSAPCPVAHLVHGQAVAGPALNLLIVGDGFLETDLDQYRCAVDKLVQRLLSIPPYSDFACRLNIYRIDLVTGRAASGITVRAGCQDSSCAAKPALPDSMWSCRVPILPPLEAGSLVLNLTAPACAILDLETQLCFKGTDCRLIGPSLAGEQRLEAISACVPDTDAVLVLANSGAYSGRALVENSPPYATATLWGLGTSKAWLLPAHELGHALFGLLDEYTSPICASCNYRWSKNVVRGSEVMAGYQFPWKRDCPGSACMSYCSFASMPSATPCPEGATCPSSQGAEPCCPASSPAVDLPYPPPALPGVVGLVEGGWYRSCGYYRAESTCAMGQVGPRFCAGCRGAVGAHLATQGIASCSTRFEVLIPNP